MDLITFLIVFVLLNKAWKKLRTGHPDAAPGRLGRLFIVAMFSLVITLTIHYFFR